MANILPKHNFPVDAFIPTVQEIQKGTWEERVASPEYRTMTRDVVDPLLTPSTLHGLERLFVQSGNSGKRKILISFLGKLRNRALLLLSGIKLESLPRLKDSVLIHDLETSTDLPDHAYWKDFVAWMIVTERDPGWVQELGRYGTPTKTHLENGSSVIETHSKLGNDLARIITHVGHKTMTDGSLITRILYQKVREADIYHTKNPEGYQREAEVIDKAYTDHDLIQLRRHLDTLARYQMGEIDRNYSSAQAYSKGRRVHDPRYLIRPQIFTEEALYYLRETLPEVSHLSDEWTDLPGRSAFFPIEGHLMWKKTLEYLPHLPVLTQRQQHVLLYRKSPRTPWGRIMPYLKSLILPTGQFLLTTFLIEVAREAFAPYLDVYVAKNKKDVCVDLFTDRDQKIVDSWELGMYPIICQKKTYMIIADYAKEYIPSEKLSKKVLTFYFQNHQWMMKPYSYLPHIHQRIVRKLITDNEYSERNATVLGLILLYLLVVSGGIAGKKLAKRLVPTYLEDFGKKIPKWISRPVLIILETILDVTIISSLYLSITSPIKSFLNTKDGPRSPFAFTYPIGVSITPEEFRGLGYQTLDVSKAIREMGLRRFGEKEGMVAYQRENQTVAITWEETHHYISVPFYPLIEKRHLEFLEKYNSPQELKTVCRQIQPSHVDANHTPPQYGTLSNHGTLVNLLASNRVRGRLMNVKDDRNLPTIASQNKRYRNRLEFGEWGKPYQKFKDTIMDPWMMWVKDIEVQDANWKQLKLGLFQKIAMAMDSDMGGTIMESRFHSLLHDLAKLKTQPNWGPFKEVILGAEFHKELSKRSQMTSTKYIENFYEVLLVLAEVEETEGEEEDEGEVRVQPDKWSRDLSTIVRFLREKGVQDDLGFTNTLQIHRLNREIEALQPASTREARQQILVKEQQITEIQREVYREVRSPIEAIQKAEEYKKGNPQMYRYMVFKKISTE